MLVQAPFAATAQIGGAPSPFLSPPALPSTLPGGIPLPTLPPGAQADILQRILDGGAIGGVGRPATMPAPWTSPGALPAAAASPNLPSGAPPMAAASAEPLSPAEAFFAAREPPGVAPPLRQFGYDSLSATTAPSGAPFGQAFGAVPDDYLIGRDDELVLAFRGRTRQTMSLRVGRDGALLVPDLAPIPAAGRRLRDLRADLEARAARDLGGSEVFVSLGQLRQMAVFVGGEVQRPGMQALTSFASVLDALGAAGGVRRTGSLRAVRVEGPAGRRTVDLYPVIAGEGGATPDLMLREGERILVPPLGGAVAVGGEVTRPGIYELPAGVPSAPLASVLALAGQPLRPAGNRFVLDTTDDAGRRSLREIGPRDGLRRGDVLRVEPATDVAAGRIRLAGHVAAPLTRAASGNRAGSLRALLSDPRLVRPDPYPRLGVVWRTDSRSRARRFLPFDLARLLQGGADVPLAEGDEVVLLGQADVLWLASPSVQGALRGDAGPAADPNQPAPPLVLPAALQVPGVPGFPAGQPSGPAYPGGFDCPALSSLAVAAQASRGRFAHARSGGFPDIGRLPCPQVFVDYPALLPFVLDQAVLLTGEVGLPGLYPITGNTGLDAVLAAAGGAADTADLSGIR